MASARQSEDLTLSGQLSANRLRREGGFLPLAELVEAFPLRRAVHFGSVKVTLRQAQRTGFVWKAPYPFRLNARSKSDFQSGGGGTHSLQYVLPWKRQKIRPHFEQRPPAKLLHL
jgi:hypothetical protein